MSVSVVPTLDMERAIAASGYDVIVGFDEGGALTEAVRRNPYAVILFENVACASAEVRALLLRILEGGGLPAAKPYSKSLNRGARPGRSARPATRKSTIGASPMRLASPHCAHSAKRKRNSASTAMACLTASR